MPMTLITSSSGKEIGRLNCSRYLCKRTIEQIAAARDADTRRAVGPLEAPTIVVRILYACTTP